jgi:O-antigen/teichoic acid export membrane protein
MQDSASKVKHGLVWLGAAGATLRAIDFTSSIVILWLLTSRDMGLASLSWTFAVIIESFNGLGVGIALVQSEQLERDELDSLYWFTLGFGACFVVAIVLSSPVLASFFDTPALRWMIAVAALRLLFMSAAHVPQQLLQRNLRFQTIAAVQTLAAGLAAITKIALAALGFGAWSLVIGHTAEGLFTLLAVYALAPFYPRFSFSFARTRRFVVFGSKAAISSVLYQSYRNLDFVIVGRAFGITALGAYRVAFDLAMIPLMAILDVVNRTAFPVYSRIGVGDSRRLTELFLSMTRNLALVSGALAVLLHFYGAELLVAVTGKAWTSAGPLVEVLCWAAFLRTLTQSIPQLFHAAGRPELAAYDSLITLVCFLASAFASVAVFGSRFGANAVSAAWIATYLVTLFILRAMARTVVGLGFWEYLKNLRHPLALMSVLFVVLTVTRGLLARLLPAPFSTLLGIALGIALVTGYLGAVLGLRVTNMLPTRTPRSASQEESAPPPNALS